MDHTQTQSHLPWPRHLQEFPRAVGNLPVLELQFLRTWLLPSSLASRVTWQFVVDGHGGGGLPVVAASWSRSRWMAVQGLPSPGVFSTITAAGSWICVSGMLSRSRRTSQGNDALEKLLQETHRTHCRLGNFPPQARHQEVGVEECHPSENLAAASHPSDPLDVLSCCDVKELQGWG